MHALILGSKEYPMGTADESDPNPSGGMEIYVQGLVQALSIKDLEITIITRKFGSTKDKEKNGNVQIIRVPFMSGFYMRNPSFNIMSFLRALRLDFDIIVSNGEVSNFLGLLLSKIKHRPIIMVSHGLASRQPQYNTIVKALFSIGDRLTYPNADAVITHAPWQMKGITKKFNVIMPGFDRSRMKRTDAGLRSKYAKNKEKIIVYTGRIIAVKGIEFLIKSLKFLDQKHVCILVGDGPDAEKCKKLASEENAKVVFTGFRSDVNNFLSIADVFVLPSFSESLNYSLVEAAYMGVPLVCTDIGVISKDSAWLAKPGDEHSLAACINLALKNKDKKKIAKAKEYALGFDWNKSADEYIKIIRRLVK